MTFHTVSKEIFCTLGPASILYDERLGDQAVTPLRDNNRRGAWAQCTIFSDNRNALAERLKLKKIPTATYYPLPMHGYLGEETVDRITGAIENFLGEKNGQTT